MTYSDKLNAILYVLLNNKRDVSNPKLNFKFICETVSEVREEWEMTYLKEILINDGYVTDFSNLLELPKITHLGVKFIQDGGYVEDSENKKLDKIIKVETLKNLKRSKTAIIISVISLLVTIMLGILNIWTSNQLENKKEELELLKKRIDTLELKSENR